MKNCTKSTPSLVFGLLLCLSAWDPCAASSSPEVMVAEALAEARDRLNQSIQERDRAVATLAALKAAGRVTQAALADYEDYLLRLEQMVEENRLTVARLSSLQTADTRAGGSGDARNREIADDPIHVLDRELDESLAAFDAMLLRELELIRTASARKMSDLADEAAAAVQRLKEKGIDLEAETGKPGDAASGEPGQGGQEGDPGPESRQPSAGKDRPEEGGSPKTGGKAGPEGDRRAETDDAGQDSEGAHSGRQERYSGAADDDIVARQLREAAEKETDPELKAKLWKEYEDYKKSQR